jgi:hypothetical protein
MECVAAVIDRSDELLRLGGHNHRRDYYLP